MKPHMDALKQSFPPVADSRARVLILGSLPGEESLARARYYAHPRNQFWRLVGEVSGRDLVSLPYEERLTALGDARIALWDTIGAARRKGSLDGAIRDAEANAVARLADTLPDLRAVGFNGGKSAAIGMPQLAGREGLALIALPSSSPAYTLAYEAKLAAWRQLAEFL
jgi:hypoxanthine-DNA glycosylase